MTQLHYNFNSAHLTIYTSVDTLKKLPAQTYVKMQSASAQAAQVHSKRQINKPFNVKN
jgi:hypothetical protein